MYSRVFNIKRPNRNFDTGTELCGTWRFDDCIRCLGFGIFLKFNFEIRDQLTECFFQVHFTLSFALLDLSSFLRRGATPQWIPLSVRTSVSYNREFAEPLSFLSVWILVKKFIFLFYVDDFLWNGDVNRWYSFSCALLLSILLILFILWWSDSTTAAAASTARNQNWFLGLERC